MQKLTLKNLQQIKSAVDNGQTVYADSALYTVIKDTLGRYLIKCGNHYIGLTHADGITLNAKEFTTIINN